MLYILLTVPYAEKDAAKQAGARWSQNAKRWYIDPKRTDLSAVSRWCDVAKAKRQMFEYGDVVRDLCSMMAQWGQQTGFYFPFMKHLPKDAFNPMRARYLSTRAGALFHALKSDAGVDEAKLMNRKMAYALYDSECDEELALLDATVDRLATSCRALDCIATYL